MLTSKAIYNINKGSKTFFMFYVITKVMGISIKRRIPYEEVAGITVSKLGSEFVIHVPNEYDYRFSSPDKSELIF